MAKYFAKLDENNIVIRVSVLHDDVAPTEEAGKNFLNNLYKTSDNWVETFQDGSQRAHYAGVDGHYDPDNDVFYEQQNFPSWTLNTETWEWVPPKPKPEDKPDRELYWNEEAQLWVFRKTVPDFKDDPIE